jgi:Mn2+/Fe2+ NRAMP family transporter
MAEVNSKVEADRQLLRDAEARGGVAKLGAFVRLSGPGWLQSAITLGGGSLASSLYLGVLAGFAFLWLQPLAMILGIIMLGAIAYVTTSTGERPFKAINEHVSPVLGWAWLLASLSANMFWCLPQFGLATGVLQQNLLPDAVGPDSAMGDFYGKLTVSIVILIVTIGITWAYDSGSWGIKLYELLLKLMVAGVVLCFIGVVVSLGDTIHWGELFAGFIPDFSQFVRPTSGFDDFLAATGQQDYWSGVIVSRQQDAMIGAAATAVGINMTFLFPYSMLAKGWTREFRGLAIFDLSTGMLIPFMLATSCVVIAAANRFHCQPEVGLYDPSANVQVSGKAEGDYYKLMTAYLTKTDGQESVKALSKDDKALRAACDAAPVADRRIAASIAERDVFDLAKALSPLTGDNVANIVFGLGVLGMALSTITLLMLISGFCICEALGLPSTGWPHRLGCLAGATGVLGPFIWSRAAPALAVYVSSFGLMLLPIAYWAFFFLMNRPNLLKEEMPRGGKRLAWNSLMIIAAGIATAASIYSVHKKMGMTGLYVMGGLLAAALVVHFLRRSSSEQHAP